MNDQHFVVLEHRVVVVNNTDTLNDAIGRIDGQETLYVDCEGVDLSRLGTLRLVTIGTAEREVYLFDVERGSEQYKEQVVAFLKRILESCDVVKVLHGCNLDSDAMKYNLNITLDNVVDTQSVYGDAIGLNRLIDALNIRIEGQHLIPTINYKKTPDIWKKANDFNDIMIRYASFDVIALRHIWEIQSNKIDLVDAIRKSRPNLDMPRSMIMSVYRIENLRAVGRMIGRGGSNLRQVQASTGTFVYGCGQNGSVTICGNNEASINRAVQQFRRYSQLTKVSTHPPTVVHKSWKMLGVFILCSLFFWFAWMWKFNELDD